MYQGRSLRLWGCTRKERGLLTWPSQTARLRGSKHNDLNSRMPSGGAVLLENKLKQNDEEEGRDPTWDEIVKGDSPIPMYLCIKTASHHSATHLCNHLPMYLCSYLSTYLPIRPSAHPPTHPLSFIHPFIIYVSMYLLNSHSPAFPPIHLSIHSSIYPSSDHPLCINYLASQVAFHPFVLSHLCLSTFLT